MHPSNAFFSILTIVEGSITLLNLVHPAKADSPMTFMPSGNTIEDKETQLQNVTPGISVKPGSNTTLTSWQQFTND